MRYYVTALAEDPPPVDNILVCGIGRYIAEQGRVLKRSSAGSEAPKGGSDLIQYDSKADVGGGGVQPGPCS